MRKHKSKTKKTITWADFIKHPFVRKNEPMLHTVEWSLILFAFFIIGLPIIYFQSGEGIVGGGKLKYMGNIENSTQSLEIAKQFVGETISEPVVDITGWDTYRNQWYGFEIKHPDNWTNMIFKTAGAKSSRYDVVYKFRKEESGENDPYIGFDVAVYPTKKADSLENTNDVVKRDNAPEDTSSCPLSDEMILGEENIVFQKASVRKGNACFEPAYFFSIKKDDYLYDIVPVAREEAEAPVNPEQDVNEKFPEYKQVVASFKNIPISRPLALPRAVARSRPSFKSCHLSGGKVSGGKIICAAKHDHPRNSPNKGHHMDEDCCMDPDESRNPCCSY
ncbi:MAG TPA: hypothetical protein VK254_04290 [Candidatus Bathyarchaeia archaeon]|nr:hypothetical protein [Candidatus Bathyarchaeia archaeon]